MHIFNTRTFVHFHAINLTSHRLSQRPRGLRSRRESWCFFLALYRGRASLGSEIVHGPRRSPCPRFGRAGELGALLGKEARRLGISDKIYSGPVGVNYARELPNDGHFWGNDKMRTNLPGGGRLCSRTRSRTRSKRKGTRHIAMEPTFSSTTVQFNQSFGLRVRGICTGILRVTGERGPGQNKCIVLYFKFSC